MDKGLRVNAKQISGEELTRIAEKCGFGIFRGSKHNKVKTPDGKFVTMIPRHRKDVSPVLVKKILDAMKENGASISYD